MNDTDSSFPIALIKRRRGRAWLFAALTSLPLVGAVPVLGIAQASRQSPASAQAAAIARNDASPPVQTVVDRPATITLGALIEVQRRERELRRALAETEQRVADLPPGEGWRAQLGAFSSPEAAERQRARLIEAGVPVVIRREGALHRLQSLPAMRAETEGLCALAERGGIDCFIRQAS